MGVYTAFRDSYAREASFGSAAVTAADDQTYYWGVMGKKQILPSPTTEIIYQDTPLSSQEVSAGNLWKSVYSLMGNFTVGMQNGILIEAVMGKSSTAGEDPYTHTITTPTAVAGILPELSSFTLIHEKSGSATDWLTRYTGAKVAGLHLTCGFEQKYLIANVDWICKKSVIL